MTNPNGQRLANLTLRLPICRIRNTTPTFISHQGTSIVDHILCTETLFRHFDTECFIGTTITSDHLPLLVKANFHPPPPPPPRFALRKDFANADWEAFSQMVKNNIPRNPQLQTPQDLDTVVEEVTNVISDAVTAAVPTKTYHLYRHRLPPDIVTLIKTKRRVFRHFLRTRDPAVKTEYNRLNALIRRETNRAQEENWTRAISSLDYRKGKLFWRKFNTLTRRKVTGTSHLTDQHGVIVSANRDKAELFAQHLQDTFQSPDLPNFDHDFKEAIEQFLTYFHQQIIPDRPLPLDDPLLSPIGPNLIAETLQRGRNSASGPDGLNRLILRRLPQEALHLLASIYNRCLQISHFPTPWKSSTTVMIPKPNADLTRPASYRPISLISCLGKCLEQIVTQRLREFTESRNLLPPKQFGFRGQRSTQDPLLKLHSEVTKALNMAHCTLAVFLDIKQAFDRVWHAGLIHKLRSIGIPEQMTKFLLSYLSHRSMRVKVGEMLSQSFTPLAGVPQGSPLAPILYTIYTYDSPQPINRNTTCTLFADDTAFWTSASQSRIACLHLNTTLRNFTNWTNRWRIQVNPVKTQTILFRHPDLGKRRKQQHEDVHVILGNTPLTLTDEITYLGMKFNRTLNWNSDLNFILGKIRNRSNLLSALRGRIRGCDPKTLQHTYKTFIRPLIDYRAPLYCTLKPTQLKQIAACERHILRKIHRLHYRHPSNLTIQHANITPITDRLTKLQTTFTSRRVHGNILPTKQTLLNPCNNTPLGGNLPKVPRRKLKYPPIRLTQLLEDLPPEFETLLDNTPYTIR